MENSCSCCGGPRTDNHDRIRLCPACLVAFDRFAAAALGSVIIRYSGGKVDPEEIVQSAANAAESMMTERKRRLGV